MYRLANTANRVTLTSGDHILRNVILIPKWYLDIGLQYERAPTLSQKHTRKRIHSQATYDALRTKD